MSRVHRSFLVLFEILSFNVYLYEFICTGLPSEKRIKCPNGFKANYKKDIISSGKKSALKPYIDETEPTFGLWESSRDPNILDRATVVYGCLRESE